MGLTDEWKAAADQNPFLTEHVKKTLRELKQAYAGAGHAIHLAIADLKECREELDAARKSQDVLRKQHEHSLAAIGALQEKVVVLEESLAKARAAFAELRNGAKGKE